MNQSHHLAQLLQTLTPEQLLSLQLDPVEIIAGDRTLITYRPRLNELTGSVTATILLQQIMYWWIQKRRPFYKFKEPCNHSDCRPGDSWTEELGFSKHEFDTALKRIGVKVTNRCSREEALKTGLVIYWTDMDRKTWYELNEPLLRLKLIELYSIKQPEEGRGEPGNEASARKSGISIYVNPESGFTYDENPDLPPSGKRIYVKPESGDRNIRNTETTTQRSLTETTRDLPPPEPAATSKEEEVLSELTARLEQKGVFPGPAREIAQRAVEAQLGVGEVLERFDAHLEQTGKIELATWRLKEGLLEPPAPATAAAKVRRSFQVSMSNGGEEPPAPASSPTLWDRALELLQGQMTAATFDKHLRGSHQLAHEGEELVVAVRSKEASTWLEKRLYKRVMGAVQDAGGSKVSRLQFIVEKDGETDPEGAG